MFAMTAEQKQALEAAFLFHALFRETLHNPKEADPQAYQCWERMRDEKLELAGLPNPFKKEAV